MSNHLETDSRTRWGRTRFGNRNIPATAIAIPTGLLLSAGVGALTRWTGVAQGDHALLIAAVFALCMSWGFMGLVWALIVDRATLLGSINNPDESIESKWLDAAMAGALRDTIMLTGFCLAILAITDAKFDAEWSLIGVILIAVFSTSVRYLMAKKRG